MLRRERYLDALRPYYDQYDIVKVLTGIRRCGKSVLLSQIAEEIAEKTGADHVILLNFELTDYADIHGPADLDRHIRERIVDDRPYYVFLDEVQEVPGFEKGINSLRARGNISLFITGSNAHLLSGELATYLSGRYVEHRVWPLSYTEALHLEGASPAGGDTASLMDYLTWGGLPQRFAFEGSQLRAYLRDVFNSVILRDVVQRSGVRDIAALETILDFTMENLGRVISPGSITDYLKSQRRSISTETIYAYLRAMTDSLLLNRVRRWDVRGKRILATLDKYYSTDLGILTTRQVGAGPGIGDRIENTVYTELRSRGFDVYTGKTSHGEIDFVAIRDSVPHYIQVAYLIADENVAAREFGAFSPVGDNYPKYVISADPLTQSRDGIVHLGLVPFLVDPPGELT
jgi:predicted AAA+ superfamily ATPase